MRNETKLTQNRPNWLTSKIREILNQRQYLANVRTIRNSLTSGMRVIHVDEMGQRVEGMVLNVRFYEEGGAEGWFLADDTRKAGWKPAVSFLPPETL